jgi:hypothetical protein
MQMVWRVLSENFGFSESQFLSRLAHHQVIDLDGGPRRLPFS